MMLCRFFTLVAVFVAGCAVVLADEWRQERCGL